MIFSRNKKTSEQFSEKKINETDRITNNMYTYKSITSCNYTLLDLLPRGKIRLIKVRYCSLLSGYYFSERAR